MPGRSLLWLLFLFACVLFQSGTAQALPQQIQVMIGSDEGPVAPPLLDGSNLRAGQGLCGAFRADPTPNFPQRVPNFATGGKQHLQDALNLFMDKGSGSPAAGERWDGTLQSAFDLTNNTTLIGIGAEGDFIMTPSCTYNGCPFPPMNKMGDPMQGFGSRFRGFLHVPPGALTLHFGFYTDDAVSLMIWTRKPDPGDPTRSILVSHVLLSRAAEPGSTKYRVTNVVSFPKAGLYPIEIVHANISAAAVLEFAVHSGTSIMPFDDPVGGFGTAGIPLSTLGFTLDFTQPQQFFQTATGALSYSSPAKCRQCPRNLVNLPPRIYPPDTCEGGMFCNEAAVCAPCQGDQFCGKSCEPCTPAAPFCVQKTPDTDFTCVQCREDKDCAQGLKCIDNQCKNPCTCCPDSPYCIETDIKKHPGISNCSACRSDTDCGTGKCDLLNARCVDSVPECNDDEHCGPECVNCAEISKNEPNGPRPYCLYGKSCAQCRFDYDCKPGNFCRSGDCIPCTHDRHCGASCKSCGLAYKLTPDGNNVTTVAAELPFCLAPGGQVENATCVSCLVDAHCGPGGKCDPAKHECENKCQTTCEPGKFCTGDRCVECLTSSQCLCGQCVDGACTPSCADTTDCNSMQCCQTSTGQCVREKCSPYTAAGGALCCSTGSVAAVSDPANETGRSAGGSTRSRLPLLALLAMLAVLYRLRPQREVD